MFVCPSQMFVCPSHIQTNIILYQGYEGNLVKKQDEQTNRKSHYLGTFTPEGRAMAAVGGQFASLDKYQNVRHKLTSLWVKPRNNDRGIVERWRILNTLVLAGQTGRLGLLGSRGGAFYEPYILRELREIRVHIESSCPRPLGYKHEIILWRIREINY